MNSQLFNIDLKDVLRGVITAVIGGAIVATFGIVSSVGFDVFHANWHSIGQLTVNGAFAGFVAYIGNRFFSDNSGHMLGAQSL